MDSPQSIYPEWRKILNAYLERPAEILGSDRFLVYARGGLVQLLNFPRIGGLEPSIEFGVVQVCRTPLYAGKNHQASGRLLEIIPIFYNHVQNIEASEEKAVITVDKHHPTVRKAIYDLGEIAGFEDMFKKTKVFEKFRMPTAGNPDPPLREKGI